MRVVSACVCRNVKAAQPDCAGAGVTCRYPEQRWGSLSKRQAAQAAARYGLNINQAFV